MSKSSVPPFIRIPSHVDGEVLYSAASRLESKLYAAAPRIKADLLEFDPTGYMYRNLGAKQGNFLSYLQIYAYILSMAIPETNIDLSDLSLLDYGGGWGIMSLVAKEAGFGTVTYLDHNGQAADAADILSKAVNLPIEERISGNETELLRGTSDRFDSIVSSDVVEHVYDLDILFKALNHVCSPDGVVFHHTGANPKSPYQRFQLTRLHRRFESFDPKELRRIHATGARALWEHRRDFIHTYAPDITELELIELAKTSRGLNQDDLKLAVDKYRETKVYPVPTHQTNTCNLEGYWYERLMDPSSVVQMMETHGFDTRLSHTYWGPGRSSIAKRYIKHGLNLISSLSISLSMRLSFYYALRGVKRPTSIS